MTPNLSDLLPELERLLGEATPGEWVAECTPHPRPTPRPDEWEHWVKFGSPGNGVFLDYGPSADEAGCLTWNGYSEGPDSQAAKDCELIAALKNAAPVLIEQARRGVNISDEPSLRVLTEIDAERKRQVEVEGYDAEHDDEHDRAQLAEAAAAYALAAAGVARVMDAEFEVWPWGGDGSFKPSDDPRKNLIRAGALVVAEIERLDRKDQSS